ncbi:MAG: hypothetical protein NZ532_03915 [Thermoflexales bacterium]|nr:hypothetical protein [Thermoflexales bacterium]
MSAPIRDPFFHDPFSDDPFFYDPFFCDPVHPRTPPTRLYVYPLPRPKPRRLRALENDINSNPFAAIPYWLCVWGLKLSWRMLKALFRSIRKRRQMV